jgi:hypothetical protein
MEETSPASSSIRPSGSPYVCAAWVDSCPASRRVQTSVELLEEVPTSPLPKALGLRLEIVVIKAQAVALPAQGRGLLPRLQRRLSYSDYAVISSVPWRARAGATVR